MGPRRRRRGREAVLDGAGRRAHPEVELGRHRGRGDPRRSALGAVRFGIGCRRRLHLLVRLRLRQDPARAPEEARGRAGHRDLGRAGSAHGPRPGRLGRQDLLGGQRGLPGAARGAGRRRRGGRGRGRCQGPSRHCCGCRRRAAVLDRHRHRVRGQEAAVERGPEWREDPEAPLPRTRRRRRRGLGGDPGGPGGSGEHRPLSAGGRRGGGRSLFGVRAGWRPPPPRRRPR
mmetsp:Transcript_35540/g.102172  ORF Transcript_35540/g.102172 Transcript_35540/m.102172 type:complete len:230 (+) Transcript_35540:313-1002(+)